MISNSLKKFYTKNTTGIFLVMLVLSCAVSALIGAHLQKDKYRDFLSGFKVLRENSDKYNFINPLIGNLSSPATEVGIFSDIQEDIKDFLDEEKEKGNLYNYSFYFRDLNSGLWFGVNETEAFFPASLFKLPIAIAAYKQAENDPDFLKKSFIYTADLARQNQEIKSNADSALQVGGSYTVDELIDIMLINSDRLAVNLDKKYISDLFDIVSLTDPNNLRSYEVSSRKYALFLRILYGSSYISEDHSERIMKDLSKSTFKDGMVAGIPGMVKVAHKFGTYQFEDVVNGVHLTAQQLHDCGIVYHPEKPYVFCFMTKGKDLDVLYNVISKVSAMVYSYQDMEDH